MNIYHNSHYNAPLFSFETTKKSFFIATQLKKLGYTIKNPTKMLELANSAIGAYTERHYLHALKHGDNLKLAESSGLKWDFGIYQMVANSTAGILSAIDDVVSGDDVSVSLSSGLHHATPKSGRGFCTINSLAIGAIYASTHHSKRVTVLDLDAHCGGGTYQFFEEQRNKGNTNLRQIDISIEPFDAYISNDPNDFFYKPPTSEPMADEEYLELIEGTVRELITHKNTDIVLYNAGVDIFPELKAETVIKRDQIVAKLLQGIPTVIVMAGGYGAMEKIVPLHVGTIGSFTHSTTMAEPSSGMQIYPLV